MTESAKLNGVRKVLKWVLLIILGLAVVSKLMWGSFLIPVYLSVIFARGVSDKYIAIPQHAADFKKLKGITYVGVTQDDDGFFHAELTLDSGGKIVFHNFTSVDFSRIGSFRFFSIPMDGPYGPIFIQLNDKRSQTVKYIFPKSMCTFQEVIDSYSELKEWISLDEKPKVDLTTNECYYFI